MQCVVTTFSTLHGFDEDPSAVGKYPVPAAVTVLAIHHGAQRMGDFKQLPPGLMMLLQMDKTHSVISVHCFDLHACYHLSFCNHGDILSITCYAN